VCIGYVSIECDESFSDNGEGHKSEAGGQRRGKGRKRGRQGGQKIRGRLQGGKRREFSERAAYPLRETEQVGNCFITSTDIAKIAGCARISQYRYRLPVVP
jgi:hypothetical protein